MQWFHHSWFVDARFKTQIKQQSSNNGSAKKTEDSSIPASDDAMNVFCAISVWHTWLQAVSWPAAQANTMIFSRKPNWVSSKLQNGLTHRAGTESAAM